MLGGNRRKTYDNAFRWATDLTTEIESGKYLAARTSWINGMILDDPISTSMVWANETNAYVCSHGQELSGEYFEKAAPVIELQVAKAGYRLAAWLDLIAERMSGAEEDLGEL
ncbi:hypothetical protein O1611_g4727 [Lasiodiplodia mahajangana]|uniref:Uncharacterized protein n=1 Tax=Lasiodiplodia mahajangana TaxID=1108764 RepID=A0ACC2JNX2_9PEZI|nr:hypothetical protein O1611_g4727 [Lasiodiplodia mahajangana]